MIDIGALEIKGVCFYALRSFGYSASEAEHEWRVALFLHMIKGNTIEYPQAWLAKVLYRSEIMKIRKHANKVFEHAEQLEPEDDEPAQGRFMSQAQRDYLIRSERATLDNRYIELVEKILKLPEKRRKIMSLYYVEGYSQKELVEILNIPLGTVKSSLKRESKKLQNEVFQC